MTHDIALIGMAGIFPNAPDVYTFWDNIVNKVEGLSEAPPEAWDVNMVYDPDNRRKDRIQGNRGGFLGKLATFDPKRFGVKKRGVDGTEPGQWLALEAARNALDDAGYGEDIPERHRTAVVIGRGTYINRGNSTHFVHGSLGDETIQILEKLHPDYTEAELDQIRDEIRSKIPPFSNTSVRGLIPNIIAGRIANKLDLMGPSYTVDAACSSAVVAVEQAVKGLRSGEYDMALVGGAYVTSPSPMSMIFQQLRVLSKEGVIRPFSADSDGTVLGEGIGMVVLKRLEDALRDDNPIYAVIKGVGVASDGSGRSVLAPNAKGALVAMERAYTDAQVTPEEVTLLEAHGLGTIGDDIEFDALTQFYGSVSHPIPMGTVKPMTGHLMPASGVAALIKTSLALHHKVLPPTLNVENPNPELAWESSPLVLNGELREWAHSAETPRRAAINSYGFGGVSTHMVLEEAPIAAKRPAFVPIERPTADRVQILTNPRALAISDEFAAEFRQNRPNNTAATVKSHEPQVEKAPDPIVTKSDSVDKPAVAPPVVSYMDWNARPTATQQPTLQPTAGEQSMSTPSPLAPAMMAAYTDLMKTFLNVQRDVMIAALGGQVSEMPAIAAPPPPAPAMQHGAYQAPVYYPPVQQVYQPAPAPMAPPPAPVNGFHNGQSEYQAATAVVEAPPTPAVVEVVEADSSVNAASLTATLVNLVAERTGYPAEMVELDLDLEADLGIDSIKRVEILGSFQKQFGDNIANVEMDDLTEKKSIREIVDYVLAQQS